MQLYLARIARENLPQQKKGDKVQFRDTLKLVDGARESQGTPVIYFQRSKLKAGKYILFYRAAFNTHDAGHNYKKGGKDIDSQVYCQESSKIVLGIQAPEDA